MRLKGSRKGVAIVVNDVWYSSMIDSRILWVKPKFSKFALCYCLVLLREILKKGNVME